MLSQIRSSRGSLATDNSLGCVGASSANMESALKEPSRDGGALGFRGILGFGFEVLLPSTKFLREDSTEALAFDSGLPFSPRPSSA